ncbi:hypothetical protein R50072_05720 [Simiduia litorea]|uniref:PilW family protein n=1 Tax=Simiduia litorea TaxID=1435348 RepID=UPI0036F2D102
MIILFSKASLGRQVGMTLVELMVSITISMIIMAGVIQLYFTASQTQRSQEGVARIQENMRYLFGKLEEDLTQTGHVGCVPFEGGVGESALIKVLLLDKKSGLFDFEYFINGADATGLRSSDTITLRYFSASGQIPLEAPGMADVSSAFVLDDADPRYALLERGDIALISDCSFADVFMITNDPTASGGTIEHAIGVTVDGQSNISADFQKPYGLEAPNGSSAYLFGGSSAAIEWKLGTSAAGTAAGLNCADDNKQYCALFRDGDEMAEGIEDLQVQYGWLDAADVLKLSDAGDVADWNAVQSVTVTLTINSIQYAPTLDGSGLMSKQVSKTFMLRNQLPGAL